MGLGTKIKEALHGDHQTTDTTPSNTTSSTGNYSTPGTFPSDDLPQKHAANDSHKAGAHTGATSGLASSGPQRNKLSKGTDEYDSPHEGVSKFDTSHRTQNSTVPVDQAAGQDHASKGAYWGDLSKDGQRGAARDVPERTRLGEETSGTTGRHHGATDHGHDHRRADQAVGGGVYNATPAQGSHGLSNRDPTEDSHFGERLTGTTGRHHGEPGSRDHHMAGQSSGGGVYNSVTGSGSSEHYGARTGQTGAVHDPLSSGTKGIPLSSGNTAGNNYDNQNTEFRGDGVPTSQHKESGHGHGLGAIGAASGVGAAAGYGAHEHGHHNRRDGDTGYSGNAASDGVPRSSMLDPEPAFHSSNSPAGGQSAVTGYNNTEGHHATHGSRTANTGDFDRVSRDTDNGGYRNSGGQSGHLSGGASNLNTNTGSGSGLDSSASPTQSASSGSGRQHLGPGHEGAKVMHSCQHCGRDNDISHYFNKDVVYRLGQ